MFNIDVKALSREQFLQLREAKRLIKEEFSISIALTDEKVLDQIYSYALESENEKLFDVFESITGSSSSKNTQSVVVPSGPEVSPQADRGAGGLFSRKKKAQTGDVIDGRKVVRMYRGAPVFEEA